jgi:hypothetical protein
VKGSLKRIVAVGVASVALAGGALVGGASAASAAPAPAGAPAYHGTVVTRLVCVRRAGYWTRVWHRGYRDRRGRWHAGHWTRVWHPSRLICRRVR